MNGSYAIGTQSRLRKITKIERYDLLRAAMDRSRKHVAIAGVGKGCEPRLQEFKAVYQAVRHGGIHEFRHPPETGPLELRPLAYDCIDPFCVNTRRPPCSQETGTRQFHGKIANRCGIQHTCVIHDGKVCHPCPRESSVLAVVLLRYPASCPARAPLARVTPPRFRHHEAAYKSSDPRTELDDVFPLCGAVAVHSREERQGMAERHSRDQPPLVSSTPRDGA